MFLWQEGFCSNFLRPNLSGSNQTTPLSCNWVFKAFFVLHPFICWVFRFGSLSLRNVLRSVERGGVRIYKMTHLQPSFGTHCEVNIKLLWQIDCWPVRCMTASPCCTFDIFYIILTYLLEIKRATEWSFAWALSGQLHMPGCPETLYFFCFFLI